MGLILGSLFLNTFINDLLVNIVKSNVCNFADDDTLYSFDETLDSIFSNLKYDIKNVLSSFQVSFLKANPSKFQFFQLFHLLFLGINKTHFLPHILMEKN